MGDDRNPFCHRIQDPRICSGNFLRENCGILNPPKHPKTNEQTHLPWKLESWDTFLLEQKAYFLGASCQFYCIGFSGATDPFEFHYHLLTTLAIYGWTSVGTYSNHLQVGAPEPYPISWGRVDDPSEVVHKHGLEVPHCRLILVIDTWCFHHPR